MSIFTDSPTIGNNKNKSILSKLLGAIRALNRSGSANESNVTNVASGTASVTLLEANPRRVKYTITNTDSNALYVLDNDGTAVAATAYSKLIAENTEKDEIFYTGKVVGIWAGDSTGVAIITEYLSSY
jgi:hypothetical protein